MPDDIILAAEQISHVYASPSGDVAALDAVTLGVARESFVCLVGPSGCGKSTLLRILAGLLPASEGEAVFHGQRLDGPQGDIGIVFQNANLMPWRTVIENILLPLEVGDRARSLSREQAYSKAKEMVELVGLQGFDQSLPRDLSGGMAQRVAIARALVHDPEVLLLDEPFGALDALTRERMGHELLRIWQAHRKTVLMVTHSISEALLLADRVLVLTSRPGRVCLDLPVDLPRPRDDSIRYSPRFGELAGQIRDAIGES